MIPLRVAAHQSTSLRWRKTSQPSHNLQLLRLSNLRRLKKVTSLKLLKIINQRLAHQQRQMGLRNPNQLISQRQVLKKHQKPRSQKQPRNRKLLMTLARRKQKRKIMPKQLQRTESSRSLSSAKSCSHQTKFRRRKRLKTCFAKKKNTESKYYCCCISHRRSVRNNNLLDRYKSIFMGFWAFFCRDL